MVWDYIVAKLIIIIINGESGTHRIPVFLTGAEVEPQRLLFQSMHQEGVTGQGAKQRAGKLLGYINVDLGNCTNKYQQAYKIIIS